MAFTFCVERSSLTLAHELNLSYIKLGMRSSVILSTSATDVLIKFSSFSQIINTVPSLSFKTIFKDACSILCLQKHEKDVKLGCVNEILSSAIHKGR